MGNCRISCCSHSVVSNSLWPHELEHARLPFHCCCCQVASVVSDSVRPHRRQPTRLPVPGILQARTLEWVAISFSNAWKWKVKVKSLSRVQLLATPWTAAYQAPLSMGFSRQEYWSGVPLPSPFTTVSQFAQTHIQWCHPTVSSCHPLLLLPSVFPSIRVFSSKSALCIMWPKYWSFSFSISSSNEYADFL